MKKKVMGLLLVLGLALSACTSSRQLSQEEAIEIASAHVAGLGVSNSIVYSADLKNEGSANVWYINLYSNGRMFEYRIDKDSAKILKYPTGYGELVNKKVIEYNPTSVRNDTVENIPQSQAIDIALKTVPGEVLEIETDIEDGRLVWFVSVRNNDGVHELYIDKETGEIILHETY